MVRVLTGGGQDGTWRTSGRCDGVKPTREKLRGNERQSRKQGGVVGQMRMRRGGREGS